MSYKVKNVNCTMKSMKMNFPSFLAPCLYWYLTTYFVIYSLHPRILTGCPVCVRCYSMYKTTEYLYSQSSFWQVTGSTKYHNPIQSMTVGGVESMGRGSRGGCGRERRRRAVDRL